VLAFIAALLTTSFLSVAVPAAGNPVTAYSFASADHDPGRHAEALLEQAEVAFDRARAAYDKNDVEKGDAALEEMTNSLGQCLTALDLAHKSRFYKKAELRVSNLQRRLGVLLEDIELPSRGWAEQTRRKLEEIHDKLLAGAMRK